MTPPCRPRSGQGVNGVKSQVQQSQGPGVSTDSGLMSMQDTWKVGSCAPLVVYIQLMAHISAFNAIVLYKMYFFYTVKQDISADTLFSRLGDFAVPRILIFADAGTEHSSFIVLLSHISYFY